MHSRRRELHADEKDTFSCGRRVGVTRYFAEKATPVTALEKKMSRRMKMG